MRMRKKKWAQPWVDNHPDFVYQNPTINKGKWKELLHGETLHLEIGTGKGGYLNGMSKLYPNDAWVGIEKDISAGAVGARHAIEEENPQVENKRFIIANAEMLQEWFAPGEVDVIHLNFSDPWPKKGNHKRRLSSAGFLAMYRIILSEGGYIRMKTDNKDLFEDSVLYFLENGFTLTEFSVDYRRNPHDEDVITEYEKRFMDLGQPIYQLCAKPCSNQ
ncbi:MAG: tRNA (guanosine(46)-N7)-methyltransferase TrmB [Erysipelotrichaceae bacterium]|nr:tRNA (guanosine(46)-N7)-methyltransferase TrmB [Erysipelotrichaceae bacterium]MDY6034940.1 tRNA (guanosine(46)-N7)-methyltransferase TrmB [Bulleidia sp.]